MALGFLVGAIGIPLPGIGRIALGLSGVLIVALILGNLRRTAGLNWTVPLSANLVLRNLGLTLFLAQVGMASGPRFAATVAETGFLMLGMGVVFQMPAITYVLARIGLITARLMVRVWKTALIVILIAAAVLSPTNDIPNMLLFAAPMLVLYVVSIFVAWIFNKPRTAT